MTNKEITLDKQVEEDIEKVKEIVSRAYFIPNGKKEKARTLYSAVNEQLSNGTRNSGQQINYLEAYENTLSVFRAASYELRKEMDVLTLEQKLGAEEKSLEVKKELTAETAKKIDEQTEEIRKQIADAIFFSNRYALYFAGQVGLSLLNSNKADVKNMFSFGTQYDASKDRDSLTGMLAKMATEDLTRIITEKNTKGEKADDNELKYTLEAIFTSWVSQFNWKTFKDIAEKYKVADLKLIFRNFSTQLGEFKSKSDRVEIDDKFMGINKKDIIGNEEYVSELWESMKRLLFWNGEKRENPLNPPASIFTFGEPGGGKTFTAHALTRSLAELAEEKGIPLKAFTFSITDIGSTYKDETPLKLNAIIEEINQHQGPVVMYMADADAVIPSRENYHATPEDIKLAGVFFSMFDGTRIPKGKFLPIMDANFTDKMGEAIKSRITSAKLLYLKRFSKPEEFADYAKGYMTKGNSTVGVKENEWLEIGQYLLDSGLNNREISNLLTNLRGDFKVPEELLGKGYEEAVNFRDNYLKSITKARILEEFETFTQTRMEIDRKSQE
ncbi:AAA family ATPase, partial [Candidatus Pacearchaeota archaeon]|nr:AAA family ATPase [Candidatus Pacearchaeota archaeon]